MKKVLVGIGLLVLMMSVPVFAQGPFADVPTDHWAYDAVNELQQAGIVIGYPDGTYGGKRAMTRYEFAVAIARMLPIIDEKIKGITTTTTTTVTPPSVDLSPYATKAELNALAGKIPDVSKFVTQDQLKAIQSLVTEFRDELAALGVDVDQVKRDLAALTARVKALEDEMKRVKWTGVATVFATATDVSKGEPYDIGGRPFETADGQNKLIDTVTIARDFDLNLKAALTPKVTANATFNFGNYLPIGWWRDDYSYLGGYTEVGDHDYAGITDYSVSNVRPWWGEFADEFYPYFMNIDIQMGKGDLAVGKLPLRLTPYTMWMIDVDPYTANWKTDNGYYPLDGATLTTNLGKMGVMLFAAKTDNEDLLGQGLVAKPTAGLYDDYNLSGGPIYYVANGSGYNTLYGHAAGGLDYTEQMAGGRITVPTPFNGNLGLTYYEVTGPYGGGDSGYNYDTVDIYGADWSFGIGKFPVNLSYAQTKISGEGEPTIKKNAAAFDGKVGLSLGKIGLGVGYRDIGPNFGAPGFWDKVGRWTNPTNVKGPYVDVNIPFSSKLNLAVGGEVYKGKVDMPVSTNPFMDDKDDKVIKGNGTLTWAFSSKTSLTLGYEAIKWRPTSNSGESKENYTTIGVDHRFTPTAGMKIGYQIVDYKGGNPSVYGGSLIDLGEGSVYVPNRYKGGIAVVQFDMKF